MTRLVSEDFFYQKFEDVYYDGAPVRFYRHKFSGAITINADDCARCLGHNSINDLIGSDVGLDAVSNWMKDHPNKPIFGDCGSGAMIEKMQ